MGSPLKVGEPKSLEQTQAQILSHRDLSYISWPQYLKKVLVQASTTGKKKEKKTMHNRLILNLGLSL